MAEYCIDGRFAIRRTYWENQDKYDSIPNKFVGIGSDTIDHFKTGLSQRGMVCALTGAGNIDALIAQPNAFAPSNIIIGLSESGWQADIDSAISKGVTQFYVDEPIQKSHQSLVTAAVPYIAARGGQLTLSESEFDYTNWYVFGGRGYIGQMIDFAATLNPMPFVSCHTHFDHQLGGATIDPRDQWDYINSRVPPYFKFAWIKTRQTSDEMGLLFGHANSIGLNKLLLYPYDADGVTYIGRVEIAADRGWRESWLKRLQKQREDKWCCPTQTFDVSQCDLDSWQYTGLEQWV